ncbi:hypothetical protein MWN33_13305 [Starkeya koreensis]|uniref:Alpha-L-arabinofuranosidase B catalytic domain-containing protein n=1 Tax=Ancylobacter koreensis TaxID=266121 RepID=A0ABT0DNZ5_9HYPH|nr:arabinofuranosidase catalytic domain-containing protein [Ancylobacter koreensis]MCK0209008.1 hypothetical protein [Ancylobacter koreensis]
MAASFALRLDLAGRHLAAPPAPLDAFAGRIEAAFGVKRLASTYAGPCLRVRRASDNGQLDIGFAGESLDAAALLAFVGGASAYVVAWYDQTGNGRHAVQTSAAAQPRLVEAGVPELGANGGAALAFDGGDDYLEIGGSTGLARNAGAFTAAAVLGVATIGPGSIQQLFYAPTTSVSVARIALQLVPPGGTYYYARPADSGASPISISRSRGTARRLIGRARLSAGQIDVATDGAITTGPLNAALPTADADGGSLARIGAPTSGGSNRFQGSLQALVLSRQPLDIAALDGALARIAA